MPLRGKRDVCGKRPKIFGYGSMFIVRIVEKLAEEPDNAEDPGPAVEPELSTHEALMWFVAKEVSEYWSHVTEENRQHHPGSVEDYLRSLVERVRRGRST